MSDFEKRINASDLIDWIMCAFPDWCVGDVRAIVDHINEMSPAHPGPELTELLLVNCPKCGHTMLVIDKDTLVRCRDCKHRDPEDKKCDCGHAILWQLPRPDDWYCADAKRRNDEQTN